MAAGWRVAAESGAWTVSPHLFVMATMILCRARKSTVVNDIIEATVEPQKLGPKNLTGWKRPILPEYEDPHTGAGKAKGATWADWYRSRHVLFRIPVNEFTRRVWAIHGDWRPKLESGDVIRDQGGQIVASCTEAGETRWAEGW